MGSGTDSDRRVGVACLVTLAVIAGAFVAFRVFARGDVAWALLGVALLLATWWQRAIRLEGSAIDGPSGASTWPRRVIGAAVASGG